jgi:hypothetical protein
MQTLVSTGGVLLTSVTDAFARQGSVRPDGDALDTRLAAYAKSIKGNIFLASHPAYEGMRRTGSFNPLSDKRPMVVTQCQTPEDVARSIEFARSNELELAVRSGGHDVMAQSVCEGGVLIDMALMQGIELNDSFSRVRVGAGVRGGQVDSKLSESGVVVPLACHPGVGISGLTLGGGLGWVLGKYGTTADSVTAMDIITADGRTLRAAENRNEDLFWGLRGGGGNFGIVTALEYKTHPQDQVIGGFLVYPIERLGEYLHFYRETMAKAPAELMIEISVAPTNPPLLVTTVCYSGSENASKTVLAPVREFGQPLYDGIKPTQLHQLTSPSKEAIDFMKAYSRPEAEVSRENDGFYNHWRGATIVEWTDQAINTFVDRLQNAPRGWSMGIGHYMHGWPCTVDAKATPLLRDEHRSSYFFNMSWGHSRQSTDAMAWVDQSITAMQPFNQTGTYVNYLSSNSAEDVARTYGTNYPRLQSLKSKYDPDNLFHLNRNIRARNSDG